MGFISSQKLKKRTEKNVAFFKRTEKNGTFRTEKNAVPNPEKNPLTCLEKSFTQVNYLISVWGGGEKFYFLPLPFPIFDLVHVQVI